MKDRGEEEEVVVPPAAVPLLDRLAVRGRVQQRYLHALRALTSSSSRIYYKVVIR